MHWLVGRVLLETAPVGVLAMLGVLARVGVQWLCGPAVLDALRPDAVLFPDLIANVLGSAFIGFVVVAAAPSSTSAAAPANKVVTKSDSPSDSTEPPHQAAAAAASAPPSALAAPRPVFTAMTSGFAGSLTTFSSWNNDASLVLVRGGRWLDWLLTLGLGWSSAYGALLLGVHLAEAARAAAGAVWAVYARQYPHARRDSIVSRDTGAWCTTHAAAANILLAVLFSLVLGTSIVALVLLAIFYGPARPLTVTLLLAPLGAWTRFYLSLLHIYSNKYLRTPIFTLAVNVVGSVLFGCLNVVAVCADEPLDEFPAYTPRAGAVLLTAATTGFCGALTTVSTLANEARMLDHRTTWLYVITSFGLTQLLLLAINGPFEWSHGC